MIIGDNHGYHQNLRSFLRANRVIDKKGNAINRDEFKVYCVGDLMDGNTNRHGDILNLEFAEEWFDGVCLGNHEFAFIGGKDFSARRKHDRKTLSLLLGLLDKKVYVPAILIKDTLITHAGMSDKFEFKTAADAYEYIRVMWELAPGIDNDIAIFDWESPSRSYSYSSSVTGGIFELDWVDDRNANFNQVVGHSTYYTGPVRKEYDNDIIHWNVDAGAKTGAGIGGIIYDDETDETQVVFHGARYSDGFNKHKKTVPPKGEVVTYDPSNTFTVITANGVEHKTGSVHSDAPTPKEDKTKTFSTIGEAGFKKDGVGNYPGLPVEIKDKTKIIPVTDMKDLDVSVLNDPEILEIYRKEVAAGNTDLALKDLVAGGPLH